MKSFCCGALLMGCAAVGASGAENEPAEPIDKSQFHLFNPTPSRHLREMTTDRPDKTESPYTVDAGHFQFEMDLVNYVHDHERSGGVTHRFDGLAVAPINIKVGLVNQCDLQLVLQTFNYVEERGGGVTVRRHGYGDTLVRLKYNFWGNDAGGTAFAAMPYMKFPTSQDGLGNHSVEGGLILPFAIQLPHQFELAMMTEFDAVRDDARDHHHAEFVNSITVAHPIAGSLSGYLEFFSLVSARSGSDWEGTVDFGLTWGIMENLQLDAGLNIGVTKSAPDWNPFIGVSWRF